MLLLTLPRVCLVVSALVLGVLHGSDDVIRSEGDVMLASLFEVNEGKSDGTCGPFDLQAVRNAYAVQWFVQKLNDQNYIPRVKLGVETWRTCFSRVRALQAVFGLMDRYVTNSSATQAPLAGILGPSRTENAMAVSELISSFPEGQRVPQISGSATGIALGNKKIYPNFFRVIPPDGAQIQVMAELLLTLRWNYIAIVFTDEEYSRTAAAALLQETRRYYNICVPVYAAIPGQPGSRAFDEALEEVADRLKGKAAAGVSSHVLGAVFLGGARPAQQFASKLQDRANFVEIIFSEALDLQTSALKEGSAYIGVAQGALTVTPQYREVREFRQAWNDLWKDCASPPAQVLNHAWLKALKDTSPGGCTQLQIGSREQMLFTWYHVQAAAVMAAGLQALHAQACSGLPGPCSQFLQRVRDHDDLVRLWRGGLNLEQQLQGVVGGGSLRGMTNVSFHQRDGEVRVNGSPPLYEVHNFRPCLQGSSDHFCFVKVGQSSGGQVGLNQSLMLGYNPLPRPWDQLDTAQCGQGRDCAECLQPRTSDTAQVIAGHFYLVALVPVHSRDPHDPLQCGSPRGNLGADFVQAIRFALEEVNKVGGRWERWMGEKKLGAIVLDSCYSQLVVKHKLIQLHQGHVMTRSGPLNQSWVQGSVLRRITGYMGGFFSLTSLAMSDILTSLDRKAYLHLSPTSVAPGLSDRKQHPYFMRLTVSANKEILAMLDVLTALSAFFVQIIYDPVDDYSADLTKELERQAGQFGVCVAQKIEAPLRDDPSLYSGILRRLRQKTSARMVIVILQYEQILQIMSYLVDGGHLQPPEDSFVFLGSEAWARRPKVIQGRQRLQGAITIAEEIAVDAAFTRAFRAQDPASSQDPWLQNYWQARERCYFDGSFRRKGRARPCPPGVQTRYDQDPWVSYFIQAVYAFASGVGEALRLTCGQSVKDVCPSLTSAVLVDKMKQVKLDLFSEGTAKPVFDSRGDGENGYKLMQAVWDPVSSTMQYRQVGRWTAGGRLSLSVSVAELVSQLPVDLQPRTYNSSCSSQAECRPCPAASTTDEGKEEEEEKVSLVVFVAGVGGVGVVVIILVVTLVVVVRRARLLICKSRTDADIRFENDGQSTLSVDGPRQPVQEVYQGRGKTPTSSPYYYCPHAPHGHGQTPHHYHPHHHDHHHDHDHDHDADYASCDAGMEPPTLQPQRPPVPCGTTAAGAQQRHTYLTPAQATAAAAADVDVD